MAIYYRSRPRPMGTRRVPSTTAQTPKDDVIALLGGLRWRRWALGPDLVFPLARLKIGRDGLEVGPSFASLPLYAPVWRFHLTDVRAEHAGRAIRLVVRQGGELLFAPGTTTVTKALQAMESRGADVLYEAPSAGWTKL